MKKRNTRQIKRSLKNNFSQHRQWLVRALKLAGRPVLMGGSPHPVVQVGALLVDNKGQLLAAASNRFAKGVKRNKPGRINGNGRSLWINCAEQLAIAMAAQRKGRLRNARLYVTLEPCAICAGMIAEAGIREVFVPEKSLRHSSLLKAKWKHSIDVGLMKLAEAKIKVTTVKTKD